MSDVKILVVEDKPIIAHDLIDRLESFGFKDIIGPYKSGNEALSATMASHPTIAFLDIELKDELSGIEVAEELLKRGPTSIIFLTHSQDERVLEKSLKVEPVAFINKPYTNSELKAALHIARVKIPPSATRSPREDKPQVLDDRIFVKNGRGRYFILLEDILWIESNGGDTAAIMTKEKLESKNAKPTVIGYNLSKVEDKLGFFPYLVRASRYHIVNVKKIERILDHQPRNVSYLKKAVLIANNEIVLGDKYRKKVTDFFHQL